MRNSAVRALPRVVGLVTAAGLLGGSIVTGAAQAAPGLEFGSCPTGSVTAERGVQCAVISVPMDYSKPDGPRIDLTVSRIAATGARRGAIFVNPGGPGADALDYWGKRGTALPAELATDYDRFAVQPRGLRWATPLTCRAAGDIADGEQVALSDGSRDEVKRACEAAQPGYLDTITTENTARDLESVRAALGLDKINYLGISYGTYLGAVYASLFPQRVDRMVLDSNVHPDWVWTEEFAQQQVAGKQRLDDLFTWIAEHNSEYRLGETPLQVYENWVRLVSAQGGGWYANLTPPPAGVGDLPGALPAPLAEIARDGVNLTTEQAGKVQNLVRTLLSGGASAQTPMVGATAVATYTRTFWPAFARAMSEASTDPANVARLLALAGITATDPTGRFVFAAITCNENAIPGKPELLAAAVGTIATGGNAMDARADMVRSGAACGAWEPVAEPVAVTGGELPTKPLLLQSRHDALTKFEGGPALARALHGSLITVEGGDHGTFGRGNTVLDDAVMTYLRTGQVTITAADQAPLPKP
ncbi:alpha/beta fold hydrolase [Nocardia goodfellowii]|uniref:Pimeloyl-ACP methyl ester carboxylesterase n=1 Tax=Nocardia goodfellowii TaxID=882446 RepID=A0ABS4Q9M6_9NOCA|nr:alpha/beta fold hydrolase [Nocardia goodfellowii]MBP2188401.1 pimeloyl-ACP methyl ester carboxylesterase [Nocardia goodfellowii]